MNFAHVFFESTLDIFYVCEKYTIFKFGFFLVKLYYHNIFLNDGRLMGLVTILNTLDCIAKVGSQTG